jgi:hypothetical protein
MLGNKANAKGIDIQPKYIPAEVFDKRGGEPEDTMNQKEDQVLIIDLGENQESARAATTVLGQALGGMEMGMVVI